MIAIDSSVLIDLLGNDARADAAEVSLRNALNIGPVAVSDIAISEVTAGLGHGSEMADAIEELGIHFSPLELRSAIRAGEMQRKYNERLRREAQPSATRRTVADFLVGAHAMLQCDGLITRDAGFFRDYFKGLKVIVPQSH
ncbi:MAG: type II toxin-antitoxin system VapC family toxin [Burkholderiaceae bacterium]